MVRPRRIFKYPLEPDRRQVVMMHEHAEPIRVCEQNNQLVMYAIIDPYEAIIAPRVFVVLTTGDNFDIEGKHFVGAATLGGWFEAFVFEQTVGVSDVIDSRHADDYHQIKQELNRVQAQ